MQAPVYRVYRYILSDAQTYPISDENLARMVGNVREQHSVLENLDRLLGRPTDPSEPLGNHLGIVRHTRSHVERRAADVKPSVPSQKRT